ncbi:bifunctional diguanylate cyclase/phosphodiesterase [Pseudomonas sp. S04]|uniref:EAL domain-containing protein n=1 Tax=unclassified Pseudomonas TaxID=196821 RepID=UPI0013201845|nr:MULTISPECIES: EAL domain-containing protein [unclassified Pseudomonas]QHD00535.1 bifunctional diguanylate cyclase/phosphodiesterase [Pseudomonas sp. S04]QHF33020.1 bifunctional diguanylate cyclase/phosphodiesterase [Pseudomonas sp. S19]
MDTRVRRARRIDAQDFFVQTLEQWGDAVVVIDDQSRVMFFNAAAERFWGCPRQDVVGSHVDSLFPETLRTADDPGCSHDLSILGKDGQARWGALSVSRITLQGRTLYAAFLKDITQTRLQDIEHRLLSLSVNATRSATCIVDAAARLLYVNDGLVQLLGYSREEVLGLSPLMFFVLDTEVDVPVLPELERMFGGEPHEVSALISKRNGQRLWVHVSSAPVFDARGQVDNTVIVLTDITRFKLHEVLQDKVVGALLKEESLENVLALMCQEIERIAPEVIVSILSVDSNGILHPLASPGLPVEYSRAIEGLSIGPIAGSCGTAAYRGKPVLVTDINHDPLWADYKALAEKAGLRACWSIPVRNSCGRVAATFALYFRECRGPDTLHAHLVTAGTHLCMLALEREEARQAIRRMAYYDGLTGLPNRNLLLAKAQRTIAEVAKEQAELAVLFVDLDRFKQVNDALGHAAGDELLQVMAQRLSSVLRESDIVGRLSGDEFVLVLPRRNATQVTRFLERLKRVLSFPAPIAGTSVVLSASIGISLFPGDGQDMESLLQCADIAMYQAKRAERGSFSFFLEEMNRIAQSRLILETALRMALAGEGLELVYQPQINLHSGTLVGVEALARWDHPTLGIISPERFIPLAEECGLINELSQWVLQTACGQLAQWREQGLTVPSLSINLSPINFHNLNLAAQITQQLQRYELQAADLCVEVTEGVLLSNSPGTEQTLKELHALGVRLAIDDFGTGYSSLGYLRHLPISELKLDKSFVDDLECDASCRALSESVIGIGRGLSLLVVAEGIEHAAQRDILKAQGYEVGQGYFFSVPLPAGAFRQWLLACQGMVPPMSHESPLAALE